jgi:hypothetical protein
MLSTCSTFRSEVKYAILLVVNEMCHSLAELLMAESNFSGTLQPFAVLLTLYMSDCQILPDDGGNITVKYRLLPSFVTNGSPSYNLSFKYKVSFLTGLQLEIRIMGKQQLPDIFP